MIDALPDIHAGVLRKAELLNSNLEQTMTEQTKPKSSMTEFRKKNPRVDYFPTPEAMAAIDVLRKSYPDVSMREVIDTLVIAGIRSFIPKAVTK